MQAFLFYIDDWISSKHIEMMDATEERGYLRLLLRAAKEDDCGLPDDDAQLAIMSMMNMQWFRQTADRSRRIGTKTSGEKVRACFEARDGRLYNARLLKEFENQKRIRAARLEAGMKGGRPKANDNQKETNWLANGIANDNQTTNQNESKTKQALSPSPTSATAEEKNTSSASAQKRANAVAASDAWFAAEFWPIWPTNRNRKAAMIAARKIKPDERPKVIAGVLAQRGQIAAMERPIHAATWINAERWNDAVEPLFAPATELWPGQLSGRPHPGMISGPGDWQ